MLMYSNTDLQRAIDDIRLAVNAMTPLPVSAIADCAATYADATDAANERLRRCAHLLAKGLRSEAIQACEQEPNLLEMVSLLDFPELAAWNALLASHGFVLAPPLLLDVAEQLNRAYAEDQQLSRLFRQHRLLAMGRAPLASRITVLRRIRAADPDNAVWHDDLQLLERARLRQLTTEVQRCESTQDLDSLLVLNDEICSSEWLEPPSAAITQLSQQLVSRLTKQFARTRLERLLDPIDQAYSAFDVETARALRAEWNAAASIAHLPPQDALAMHTAPAWDWLAQQDENENRQQQYERALFELEAALDADKPRLELERLYHAAVRHEEELPVALERRLRARLEDFDLRGRRRSRLLMAGVLGVLMLIGSATAYAILQQAHSRAIVQTTATLAQLLDKEQYDDADRFLAEVASRDERLVAAPAIQAEVARMNQLRAEEDSRWRNFTTALTRAQEAGVEQPDRTALEQARQFARGNSELAEIATLESAIAAAARQSQQNRDNAFSIELNQLKERVLALESMEEAAAAAEIKLLAADIKNAHGALGISTLLKRQLDPLHARVEAKNDQLRILRAERDELALVLKHVGDVPRFTEALNTYANKFPATQRAREFQQTTFESEYWQGITPWTAWAQREALNSSGAVSPAMAKRILDEGLRLKEDHGAYPLVELFSAHQPFLEAYAARMGDDGKSLAQRVQALFRDPLVTDLFLLKTSKGKCYYLKSRPNRLDELDSDQSVGFEHISSFSLELTKARCLKGDIVALNIAPQVELALKATDMLRELDDANWDRTFYTLTELVQSYPDVDPILRIAILKRVLEFGSAGSYRFKTVFAPKQAVLTAANVDVSALWMLPDDAAATTTRAIAERALQSVQDAKYADSPEPASRHGIYVWDGLLWRDSNGAWQWMRSGILPAHGSVAVLVRPEGDTSLRFETIGECIKGSVKWTSLDGTHFREGRPLFWKGDPAMQTNLGSTTPSKGSQ
jgi:hypothetical protein